MIKKTLRVKMSFKHAKKVENTQCFPLFSDKSYFEDFSRRMAAKGQAIN